jgi:hypothetical protein
VPFNEQHKNLHYKTQSTDTSPVSYASVNTMRSTLPKIPQGFAVHPIRTSAQSQYSDYSIDRKGYFYSRPSSISTTPSGKSSTDANARNHTISESDSVFLPSENESVSTNGQLRPTLNGRRAAAALYCEPERIYDVVYSAGNSTVSSRKASASENISGNNMYGSVRQHQRPSSAMAGSMIYQQNPRHLNGRMTPLILQNPQMSVARQGDIIINNQIYRPISTVRQQPQQLIPQQQPLQQQQQKVVLSPKNQQQQIKAQPIYSSPMRRRQSNNNNNAINTTITNHNNYESDSEAGEIESIMRHKYGEC